MEKDMVKVFQFILQDKMEVECMKETMLMIKGNYYRLMNFYFKDSN